MVAKNGDNGKTQGKRKRVPGRPFEKGNPGGPGRPKGSLSIRNRIKKAVEENPEKAKEIMQTALDKATDGDLGFWREVVDSVDGPLAQKVEVSFPDEERSRIEDSVRARYAETTDGQDPT